MNGFIFGLLVGFGLQTKAGKKIIDSFYNEANKVVAKTTEKVTQIVKAATTGDSDEKSKNSRDSVENPNG